VQPGSCPPPVHLAPRARHLPNSRLVPDTWGRLAIYIAPRVRHLGTPGNIYKYAHSEGTSTRYKSPAAHTIAAASRHRASMPRNQQSWRMHGHRRVRVRAAPYQPSKKKAGTAIATTANGVVAGTRRRPTRQRDRLSTALTAQRISLQHWAEHDVCCPRSAASCGALPLLRSHWSRKYANGPRTYSLRVQQEQNTFLDARLVAFQAPCRGRAGASSSSRTRMRLRACGCACAPCACAPCGCGCGCAPARGCACVRA